MRDYTSQISWYGKLLKAARNAAETRLLNRPEQPGKMVDIAAPDQDSRPPAQAGSVTWPNGKLLKTARNAAWTRLPQRPEPAGGKMSVAASGRDSRCPAQAAAVTWPNGTLLAFIILLMGYVAGCSLPGTGNTGASSANASQSDGTIDTLVDQVLANMHLHAWNPDAMTKGVTTGGLFINWKMDDPSRTNMTRPGPTGNPQNAHDPQVDLLYLASLAEYQQLHPQHHLYDADLGRATKLVLADFRRYSLPKGWIYFYLLKSGLLLRNAALMNDAHNVARNLYTRWYDPALGNIYDRAHTAGDYATNHTLQCGAALIEAGQRWNDPSWVSAGEKTLDHVIAVAFHPQYHLFYDSMVIGSDGQDRVQSYKARPSTEGEAVAALVTAFKLTHRQRYLDVAAQVLQSLFTSSGLWDTRRGGFFFALDLRSGAVIANYKETRSQSLTLVGLHLYNQVQRQQFAQQEQQLIQVLTGHFYQGAYHGFVYRLTSDFHIYVSKPGAGIGVEDYFTTEAMGSVLDSLQQTELPE